MNDKIDNLATKLDNVTEKISDIGTRLEVHIAKFDAHVDSEEAIQQAIVRNTEVLQGNTESLKEHMQRTDLLETYVKKIDERFTPVELTAQRKQAVMDWWKNGVIFVAKLGGAATAITVIFKALSMLLKHN